MTQLRRDQEDRATDEALLKAAGARIYSREFTGRYLQDQLLRNPPGAITRRAGEAWADTFKFFAAAAAGAAALAIVQATIAPLLDYLGESWSFGLKCLLVAGGFAASYVSLDRTWCRPSFMWQASLLEDDGTYYVGFKERRVPDFVQNLLRGIRQVLPESTFRIRTLGPDPVIDCTTKSGSYTILIYDGTAVIDEA
jgi:hypothetical protein